MEFNAPFMRQALEAVQLFKKSHIMFVPMPVLDAQDQMNLLRESGERLDKLLKEREGLNGSSD
jgi:hypothetical protein